MTRERDISHLFLAYRDCARSSWNSLFYSAIAPEARASFEDAENWERFNEVLFTRLVLASAGKLAEEHKERNFQIPRKEPIPFFRVSIAANSPTPILIENPRPGDGTRYWDHPLSSVKDNEVSAFFVDFFDWDELGMRDFDYVLVRIEASSAAPDVAGRLALIETRYSRFLLLE